MNMLLSGLLKLSRLGVAALEIEPLDMNVMMDQILTTMQYQINEAHVEVKVDNLPICCADRAQISQVFTNLIDIP